MSQLVFGIPREYAFLFFRNNWDTAHPTALKQLIAIDVAGLFTH